MPRTWLRTCLLGAAVIAALIVIGYRNATAQPLVRRLTLTVQEYPATAGPLRIALFSDVHVHGPDMPPERVARIVDQINALHPDIAIGTGDFVGNSLIGRHYSVDEAIAPLGKLRARLGAYAVLGNNDYNAGASDVTRALERAGIRVLADDAVKVGPIALGGRDGRLYPSPVPLKAARARADTALRRTAGMKILATHRPDEFAFSPLSTILVLAGHTHCGQIVLPLIGPIVTGSDFGRRYSCGVIHDGSRTLVVTAGLGTSYVPLRFGAPPDIWLITLR